MRWTRRSNAVAKATSTRTRSRSNCRRSAQTAAKLAAALDGETARARRLEATNRELADRLDAAITSIQSVLKAHGASEED